MFENGPVSFDSFHRGTTCCCLLRGADVTQTAAQSPSEADRWKRRVAEVFGSVWSSAGLATEATRPIAKPLGALCQALLYIRTSQFLLSISWPFFLLACTLNQRAALLMLMYDITRRGPRLTLTVHAGPSLEITCSSSLTVPTLTPPPLLLLPPLTPPALSLPLLPPPTSHLSLFD